MAWPVSRVEARLHGARQRLALALRRLDAAVEGFDVAHREACHALVALFHLAHGPVERADCLLRLGHDRVEEMRNAVVDGKLEHLRVDHQEAAFLGRVPEQDRQDHGVDADGLARAGGAGDEQMRHAGEIGDDRVAADGAAERQRQGGLGGGIGGILEDFAQANLIAPRVGQLDADGIAAGHDGDAGAGRAHGAGDVVGERHDARQPWCRERARARTRVTTGPGLMSRTSPLTPKSASTSSSRRAVPRRTVCDSSFAGFGSGRCFSMAGQRPLVRQARPERCAHAAAELWLAGAGQARRMGAG